jgi:hypothetical protein
MGEDVFLPDNLASVGTVAEQYSLGPEFNSWSDCIFFSLSMTHILYYVDVNIL